MTDRPEPAQAHSRIWNDATGTFEPIVDRAAWLDALHRKNAESEAEKAAPEPAAAPKPVKAKAPEPAASAAETPKEEAQK